MAHHIKLATITAPPLTDPPDLGPKAVDRMIAHWRDQLARVLPDRPDLVLLPEYCDRYEGVSQEQLFSYYRARGDRVRDALAESASAHNCYIGYSALREANDGTWRNALELIDREGHPVGRYHKNHLVIPEIENGIRCGAEATVLPTDFGRVGAAICFDLNFETLRKQYERQRPDLMLFSSVYHGGLAANWWAYACRAPMLTAVSNLPSGLLSPQGEWWARTTNYFSHLVTTMNMDYEMIHLDFNEEKFPEIKRKYGPEVHIHDPGFLGSVLLISATPERSAADVIEEFELERLDDYLERSLEAHRDPALVETRTDEPGSAPSASGPPENVGRVPHTRGPSP